MTRTPLRLVLVCAAVTLLAAVAPEAGARKSAKPVFATHHEPGENPGAGEPSIGVNWETGTVLYQSSVRTMAVTFDKRGRASWDQRSSAPHNGSVTLDPILYTDGRTGRTWVSQLAADCSLMSYSDDDGKTWTPSMGCGPGAYVDHQTVGAGPFAQGLVPRLDDQLAVYYCAQAVVEASCSTSLDGGLTFGPAVPVYNLTECRGFHGHIRVAPDGTAYLPNMGCGNEQAVVVSEDNGLTWKIRRIPDSEVNGESDPSVAAGADNTVYFGYQDGEGNDDTRAMVAVSRDRGLSWSKVDVSSRLGIKNVQFPEVIAGDGDRAAIAFLGTKMSGNDQSNDFEGAWRLYVSMTYDRGKTWTTVNATPNELVQIGCIQLTGCNHRNLLDFNDITVDRQGRVYVAWADGCPRECEKGADWQSSWHRAVISRQTGGKGLFRAYDGKL